MRNRHGQRKIGRANNGGKKRHFTAKPHSGETAQRHAPPRNDESKCRHAVAFCYNRGMDIKSKIFEQVTNHSVVLYMKGTPKFPQCGFSSLVVEILKRCGTDDYLPVNVLEDPDIRQGIKEYANWPTIPQLYIRGDFVGGADIIREMYESGELKTMLSADAPAVAAD